MSLDYAKVGILHQYKIKITANFSILPRNTATKNRSQKKKKTIMTKKIANYTAMVLVKKAK